MNSNFNSIKQIITDCEDDVTKFFEGNNAAGSRVRAAMQSVKKLAQEVRKEVQTEKNSRKAKV